MLSLRFISTRDWQKCASVRHHWYDCRACPNALPRRYQMTENVLCCSIGMFCQLMRLLLDAAIRKMFYFPLLGTLRFSLLKSIPNTFAMNDETWGNNDLVCNRCIDNAMDTIFVDELSFSNFRFDLYEARNGSQHAHTHSQQQLKTFRSKLLDNRDGGTNVISILFLEWLCNLPIDVSFTYRNRWIMKLLLYLL